MTLVSDKFIFLHVPKCAGYWIRNALSLLNVPSEEISHYHATLPLTLRTKNIDITNKKIFAFVRHPASWYQSRWVFRMKTGWRPDNHPLDFACMSNDFQQFIKNCISKYPDGWATREFNIYIKDAHIVGRVEYLVDDFIKIIEQLQIPYDKQVLLNIPRANDSDINNKPSQYWAKYTAELLNDVCNSDREIITKYYTEYELNKIDMCGPPPYR